MEVSSCLIFSWQPIFNGLEKIIILHKINATFSSMFPLFSESR